MNKSMYTVLDDRRQSKIVLNYIKNNYNPSIKKIVQNCMITRTRLKYLERQGYFTLPKWTYKNELDKRFKNRQYVSVSVGREYGKWTY
jgi:hypothetical protein